MDRSALSGTRALRRLGVALLCTGCVGTVAAPARADVSVEAEAEITLDAAAAARLATDTSALDAALAGLQPKLDAAYAKVGTTRDQLQGQVDTLATSLGVSPATQQALVAAGLVLAGPTLQTTCDTLARLTPLLPISTGLLGRTAAAALDRTMSTLVERQSRSLLNALAPSQLSLLRMSWDTSFRTTGGGTLNRSALGYVGIPTLIDADGLLGYDLCATLAIDVNTLQITQQITRLPLSPATLPVDVSGSLTSFGGVSLGYRTPGSKAPVNFKTELGLGSGSSLAFDNTVTGAGPSLVQRIALGSTGAGLEFSWADAVPKTAHVGLGQTGTGISTDLNTSARTNFGLNVGLGSTLALTADIAGLKPAATDSRASLSFPGAGLRATFDGPAGGAGSSFRAGLAVAGLPLNVMATPLPASLKSCTLLASIACSGVNAGRSLTLGALGSMSVAASERVRVVQALGTGASCTSAAGATTYADVTGTNIETAFNLATNLSGYQYADTNNTATEGCTNTLGLQKTTLPAGFKAGGGTLTGRLGSFTNAGVFTPLAFLFPNALTKTGQITCPAGTNSTLAGLDTTRGLCLTPPVNTNPPVIAKQGLNLRITGNTYPAMNMAQTLGFQWQQCDAAGLNCTDIAGATNATFPFVVGTRYRVRTSATNSDGTGTAMSAVFTA